MKKIKLIFIALAGVFSINSCSEKDLELTNPNTLSPETFFETDVQVQSSVNACYANLQIRALYSRFIPYMMDNMSGENAINPPAQQDVRIFENFSWDSTNGNITDFWNYCYTGVNKCNFVISNQDKIMALPESVIPAAKKNKYIAEARFLRAHYYFMLVNRFGGVPLYDKLSADPKPRATKEQVFALINSDLEFAAANLLDKSKEEVGRITKGAALAELGKALLYQKQYAKALTAFNAMTGYSLVSNYYDNFMEETENGKESVFEVQYNTALGTSNSWGEDGSGPNESHFRGQDYGFLNWHNVHPSDNLLDEYEPGDNRYGGCFYKVGDKYNNNASTVTSIFSGVELRAAWKKYQSYYKRTSEDFYSGVNIVIIRYADVLLMKAECENEVSTQASAIATINIVRARAGLPALATTLTKDQVFKAIIHERKCELPGEQVRFDDIIRWGLASTELKQTKFQKGKHELWPIPDKEFATNPMIPRSAQNPGY
jgi:hypothetical protein